MGIKRIDGMLITDWDNQSLCNLLKNGCFEVGDPPTGWTAANSAVLAQEGTTVKMGSKSIKITAQAAYSQANQDVANYVRYAGRKVTLGAWYYCPAANDKTQSFQIYDGVDNTTSAALTKDGAWHWLTITHTLNASPTTLRAVFIVTYNADTDDLLYIDGAILVEGEVCPAFSPKPDDFLICPHTAAYTLSAYETGHVLHTNLGAGAAVTISLPQTVTAGFTCRFVVMAAFELRIDPGAAGAIYINGAKQVDDKYITADDEAESVVLTADGNGDWIASSVVGTWTVEV